MKNYCWWIKTFVVTCILFGCQLRPAMAAVNIDVEMRLNDGGFISYDHFRAELYLNNLDRAVSGASIFGILEIMGEFFFWPSFSSEVDFELMDIEPGETMMNFLAFDFGDIDDFIPFGPMRFWGAWFLDMETWNYDFKEFWLDTEHKWTPTPTPTPTKIVTEKFYIPPGTFIQGSPDNESCRVTNETEHYVDLSRGFYMMQTEVTRQMWANLQAVQRDLPDDPSVTEFSPTMDHPVQNVTWYEAVLFANLLSVQSGYTPCYYRDMKFKAPINKMNYISDIIYCDFYANGYRLPTEAEWEYACRAETTGVFSCDETSYYSDTCDSCAAGVHPILEQHSVFCANSRGKTSVVGSKLPNPWGLYDMHGNVSEWCWDWYDSYPLAPVVDPRGPEAGLYRVERGGAWNLRPVGCRSAHRGKSVPFQRDDNRGFRLVRAPSEFVCLPSGFYTSGSPTDEPCRQDDETQCEITLISGFDMMRTEVTRQMWSDLKHLQSGFPDDPSDISISPTMDHPIQNITWKEAVLFANILSMQHRFDPCYYIDAEFWNAVTLRNYTSDTIYCNFDANGYRLPTEAEWEYACRAGTIEPFSCEEANYNNDNCDTCTSGVHPILEEHCVYCANSGRNAGVVGSKLPNPWGLYDMHGNVCEWCWDWYGPYTSGSVTNPTGPETGSNRVVRGGNWNSGARNCRSANRNNDAPDGRDNQRGFRLVRKTENFIYIPPGNYLRGSQLTEPCRTEGYEDIHQVILTKGFHMMPTEVTRRMWADLKAVYPMFLDDFSYTDISPTMDHPLQNVTWYEALLFANLMSTKDHYKPCYYKDEVFTVLLDDRNYTDGDIYCDFSANGYRLPTEAEWEYACRAGMTEPFSCKERNYNTDNCNACTAGDLPILEKYCVYCANSEKKAEVVGSKLPNPWGLYDMHGNVTEWCWDRYELYPTEPVTDPTGPETGRYRVGRGGSWRSTARACRSAFRSWPGPNDHNDSLGFRLVKTASH